VRHCWIQSHPGFPTSVTLRISGFLKEFSEPLSPKDAPIVNCRVKAVSSRRLITVIWTILLMGSLFQKVDLWAPNPRQRPTNTISFNYINCFSPICPGELHLRKKGEEEILSDAGLRPKNLHTLSSLTIHTTIETEPHSKMHLHYDDVSSFMQRLNSITHEH